MSTSMLLQPITTAQGAFGGRVYDRRRGDALLVIHKLNI
jgi:hypothetical protein